jgi:hypothetical protein
MPADWVRCTAGRERGEPRSKVALHVAVRESGIGASEPS